MVDLGIMQLEETEQRSLICPPSGSALELEQDDHEKVATGGREQDGEEKRYNEEEEKEKRMMMMIDTVLWEEILSRLPVKSLMRFRCVCPRWCYLIRNDRYFIDLHLRRQTSKTLSSSRGVGLLLAFTKDNVFSLLSANCLFEQGRGVVQTINNPGNEYTITTNPSTPLNGLICFRHRDKNNASVSIYNLGTREVTPWIKTTIMKELEEKAKRETGVGLIHFPHFVLGFHPVTKEHKVICLWSLSKPVILDTGVPVLIDYNACEVLTVGQNSWRRIDEVPPFKLPLVTNSVSVNGTIYLRAFSHKLGHELIVAFDLGTEKFRDIQIPKFILDRPLPFDRRYTTKNIQLLEVDGRVALLHRTSGDTAKIWIFDDDNEHQGRKEQSSSSNNSTEETILLPGGDINKVDYCFEAIAGTDQLIITSYNGSDFIIYSYDRKKKTCKEVEISGISPLPFCSLVSTFVESLEPVLQQH